MSNDDPALASVGTSASSSVDQPPEAHVEATAAVGMDLPDQPRTRPPEFKLKRDTALERPASNAATAIDVVPQPAATAVTGLRAVASDDSINATLRDHAVSVADWKLRPLLEKMHEWWARYDERFFAGRLPVPALSFDSDGARTLGWYLPGRDALGLRHRVNLNRHYLDGPLPDVLATLLHEAIHAEQAVDGTAARGSYHNVAFRARASGLGIPCDDAGRELGATDGPFTEMLREFGVDATRLTHGMPRPRRRGESKMKKWRCGCTNVRAAVAIDAICNRCQLKFRRAE